MLFIAERLKQFQMSKLKMRESVIPATSVLILNFAFLILLSRALQFGIFLELGVCCLELANPLFRRKHRGYRIS